MCLGWLCVGGVTALAVLLLVVALAVFVFRWRYGRVGFVAGACHTGVLSAPPASRLRTHLAIGCGGSGAALAAGVVVLKSNAVGDWLWRTFALAMLFLAGALAVIVLGWRYGRVGFVAGACHTGVLSAPPTSRLRPHLAIGCGGSGAALAA